MTLVEIATLFARLGAFSFGGASAVVADMERELVHHRAVMTAGEFAAAYALGQATPGPAMLYVIPVGYHAGGPAGALVALVAFLMPSVLLLLALTRRPSWLGRYAWVGALRRSLVPISAGLIGASAYTLGGPLVGEPAGVAGIAIAALAVLIFDASPALIVLAAAVAGLLGAV